MVEEAEPIAGIDVGRPGASGGRAEVAAGRLLSEAVGRHGLVLHGRAARVVLAARLAGAFPPSAPSGTNREPSWTLVCSATNPSVDPEPGTEEAP